MPLEDLTDASAKITKALKIREKYMKRSLQHFPKTVEKFISAEYPQNLPKKVVKNTPPAPGKHLKVFIFYPLLLFSIQSFFRSRFIVVCRFRGCKLWI